eukprot:349919-Chlamydomonas_euryale.AAC.6
MQDIYQCGLWARLANIADPRTSSCSSFASRASAASTLAALALEDIRASITRRSNCSASPARCCERHGAAAPPRGGWLLRLGFPRLWAFQEEELGNGALHNRMCTHLQPQQGVPPRRRPSWATEGTRCAASNSARFRTNAFDHSRQRPLRAKTTPGKDHSRKKTNPGKDHSRQRPLQAETNPGKDNSRQTPIQAETTPGKDHSRKIRTGFHFGRDCTWNCTHTLACIPRHTFAWCLAWHRMHMRVLRSPVTPVPTWSHPFPLGHTRSHLVTPGPTWSHSTPASASALSSVSSWSGPRSA